MRLSEAFKALEALNEDTFTLSDDGIKKLAEFEDNDDLVDELSVIDLDAETEDDFEESYVGKVILDCCVCHSKLYKDKEDVEIDEESQLANVGEDCPYCYTPDGFKVIGEVAAFNNEANTEEKDIDDKSDVEIDIDSDDSSSEETTDDDLTEGLFNKKNNANIREIKATELKKGHIVVDNDGSEDKVVKVEDAGNHVDVSFKHGSSLIPKANNVKIRESISIKESYKDTSGIMGEVDAIYTAEELEDYFDNNRDTDPSLAEYKGDKAAWLKDTLSNMSPIDESLTESVNNVNVETDEDVINVSTDDSGKVTVTTEPNNTGSEEIPEDAEMIVPVSDETEADLTGEEPADAENIADETADTEDPNEEVDVEIDDFDEESFDDLGEQYFREAYSNVETFKTINVSEIKEGLLVEGVIKFTSGNDKKTSFVFESRTIDKNNNVKFLGENRELNTGKGSFTINGNINESKLILESLDYNYEVKDSEGDTEILSGKVRRG